MKMSEEMAVRLHRMMWSDMQKELGDRPTELARNIFKKEWIEKYFPDEEIECSCFLCEFAKKNSMSRCGNCPIKWPNDRCFGHKATIKYISAPISEILALPMRNKELVDGYVANDEAALVRSYYEYREQLLSKASGRPASTSIDDHVKAIQEKAVEEYFEKNPGAKLATMDVDQAFKQYADEQKAPIFHALAEASGLSAGNESVKAHINLIRDMAKQNGRAERSREVFSELAKASGLPEGKRCVSDHVKAIQAKAKEQTEPYRKSCMLLVDTLNKYKDKLSEESGLNRDRPIDDHIREIVKNSMEAGATEERDRIQEKFYEVLLS